MPQSPLFYDTPNKELVTLPVAELEHSPLNPRRTHPLATVEKLANRMLANGYEITRAVWAHSVNGHYEVFAGGTRLEAAKLAQLPTIPVLLHTGCDDAEIVRLADRDNENDEYHEAVPLVETWLSYKALEDADWTQSQIAQAKGCSQTLVSFRLKCAKFPAAVRAIISRNGMNERHAQELIGILAANNLAPWLTRETAMLDVIDIAIKKGGNGDATAKDFQSVVTEYNAFITAAQTFADAQDAPWRAAFIDLLTDSKARNLAKVRGAIDAITKRIADEKRQQEESARAAQSQAESARVEAERAERLVSEWENWRTANVKILHGDFREVGAAIPDNSVDLIFTDPPYDEKSIPLYGDLAQLASRVLKPNGSLITYVGHYAIPDVLLLMTPHLRYWWMLAVDHAGNAARLPGKWVFVHWKPMLWFVNGGREHNEFVADQVNSRQPEKSLHPWQQDTSEAAYYIEHLTHEGGTVLDPFMGSGTTLFAGLALKRQVIGIEMAEKYVDQTWEYMRRYYERSL